MKKVVRLTEADLVRIVKRVIKEQGITGRNNPRWVKLFNVLRNIGSPKVLTFKDFDGNPSQSLNWGTTKTSNANYGLAASDAHESFYLMSDNKQLLSTLFKWWSNKGYKTDVRGGEVMINFDNVDKISSDLQNFFKSFSPVGKTSIQEQVVAKTQTNSTNVPLNLNSTYEAIRSTDNQKYQITPKEIYTQPNSGYIGYMANIVGPGSYQGHKLTVDGTEKCYSKGCYDLTQDKTNVIGGNTEMGDFTITRKIK
jgi:hypothetical protein